MPRFLYPLNKRKKSFTCIIFPRFFEVLSTLSCDPCVSL
nr:MAG TPA: hypothetical protein [Caudoviricetes sp.]